MKRRSRSIGDNRVSAQRGCVGHESAPGQHATAPKELGLKRHHQLIGPDVTVVHCDNAVICHSKKTLLQIVELFLRFLSKSITCIVNRLVNCYLYVKKALATFAEAFFAVSSAISPIVWAMNAQAAISSRLST